jgi:type IV pilus assembly protein PilC
MPIFEYKARVKENIQKSKVEATDEKEAYAKLVRQGIKPLSVKEERNSRSLFSSTLLGKQKVTQKDLVVFTRTFSTMINAGLPLNQCLNILGLHAENKDFGEIIFKVKRHIENGENLSDSLKKYPKVFDSFYCNLIQCGEASGALDIVSNRLAIYIEKSATLRKKVKSAMAYPACIVAVAFAVITFLMIFVIPAFSTMFEGGGNELPVPTAIVMAISYTFRTNWYYMILAMCGVYVILKRTYASEKGRIIIDRYSLKLPVFGSLIEKVAVTKFTQTLSTLLSGGVALIEGLEICARTSGNKIIELGIMRTRDAVSDGGTIAESLSRENVFPEMFIQMVGVGENSGSLDAMLEKTADFYTEEVDTTVEGLTSLLEPALMVFLGLVVGFIVVAMYLPIFKMGGNI